MGDPNTKRIAWGNQILKKWLDPDYGISEAAIRAKGWAAVPAPDVMNVMEAEWLAQAIQAQGLRTAIGLAFEYRGEPTVEDVPATRDGLLAFNGQNSWRYVIITSPQESFLFYQDDGNRYFLLCGNADFLCQAYRCTWESARMRYFDEWVNLDHHSAEEKRFMTAVWDKYAQFKTLN
jgi:hypothetical protein